MMNDLTTQEITNKIILLINNIKNVDNFKINVADLALLDTTLTVMSDYLLIKHHDKALPFDDFGNIEPCNDMFKTNTFIRKIQYLINSNNEDSFESLSSCYNSKYYAKIMRNIHQILTTLEIE